MCQFNQSDLNTSSSQNQTSQIIAFCTLPHRWSSIQMDLNLQWLNTLRVHTLTPSILCLSALVTVLLGEHSISLWWDWDLVYHQMSFQLRAVAFQFNPRHNICKPRESVWDVSSLFSHSTSFSSSPPPSQAHCIKAVYDCGIFFYDRKP